MKIRFKKKKIRENAVHTVINVIIKCLIGKGNGLYLEAI